MDRNRERPSFPFEGAKSLVCYRDVVRTPASCSLSTLLATLALAAGVRDGLADTTTPEHHVSLVDARAILPQTEACETVECLLERGYRGDEKARAIATALYRERGDVAGMSPREQMDGGFRGTITLLPQLPLGQHRKHLEWTVDALRSFDEFFASLYRGTSSRPTYRWRGLQLRYMRSVGKRTPSAYAFAWVIAYNVRGSLNTSAERVRETLFHELFHSNDAARGGWSLRALSADYRAIVRRCDTDSKCLAPYAPGTTKMKATGVYYAFQPNNGDGVNEYGAELAVRYWHEQQHMLRHGRLEKPAFKCVTAENARSWKALVDEFFAGRDLVPPCP